MSTRLSDFSAGDQLRLGSIHHISANDMLRLQEMGVLEGTQVQILKSSDPMVVKVGQTRLGIQRNIAAQIDGYHLK